MQRLNKEIIQRRRVEKLFTQIDPIMSDITRLITTTNYTPERRAQVESMLDSLGRYLKNQRRKARV